MMIAMRALARFLYDEIAYNGHFQTWGVLALVIVSGQISGIPIHADILAVAYVLFYLIYLHDRYQGVTVDALTNSRRSQHVRKIYRFIPAILVIGFIGLAAFLLAYANIATLAFAVALAVGGALYPLHFKGLTKHVIIFKNLYVALVFALMIYFPSLFYGIPIEGSSGALLGLLAVFVFLRGVVMQLILDLKDIESDRSERLRTLGVVVGHPRVVTIINAVNILTALYFPLACLLAPALVPLAAASLALVAVFDAGFLALAARGNKAGFVLESGIFLYWPFVLLAGQALVSALG